MSPTLPLPHFGWVAVLLGLLAISAWLNGLLTEPLIEISWREWLAGLWTDLGIFGGFLFHGWHFHLRATVAVVWLYLLLFTIGVVLVTWMTGQLPQ